MLNETSKVMHQILVFRNTSIEDKKKLSKEVIESHKKNALFFENEYQDWYTECLSIIKHLIPDRLTEFIELYQGDSKRKTVDATSYHIKDWLMGVRSATRLGSNEKLFNDTVILVMRFTNQKNILSSASKKFTSSLLNIKQLLQADFFDSELDGARELNKKGFQRAAGVICGVIVEKHLRQVCIDHGIAVAKKNPTIADYNELLKSNEVIDIPSWRLIQMLADLRNLCGHSKDKEPKSDDIDDLISGTEKIIKTIF